jgi:hypothetical protein
MPLDPRLEKVIDFATGSVRLEASGNEIFVPLLIRTLISAACAAALPALASNGTQTAKHHTNARRNI